MILLKYTKNIKDILRDKNVENCPLSNIDLLKNILFDNVLGYKIYKKFLNNFNDLEDMDMLFSKTQDLVYRLNYVINNWLIPTYNLSNHEIKETIKKLVDYDADFYSAVSYDDSDKEMVYDFEHILSSLDKRGL